MASFLKTMASSVTSAYLEMPDYTVTNTSDEYEERHYPASKWVTTKTAAISRDKSSSDLFWRLFNYISGKNEPKRKIEMTAPVAMRIIPGAGPNCESTFYMSFYLGREHWGEPPKPEASEVFIEDFPAMDVYVRRFGGFAKDDKWVEEATKLTEVLPPSAKYNKDFYYTCGYDAPFKLFNRRNEVWFVKQDNTNDKSDNQNDIS